MYKLIQISTVFYLLIGLGSKNIHAQSVQVSPAIVSFDEISSKNGATITLTNSGNIAQTIKILYADWIRDSLGQHQFFAPETLPQSCSNWIQISQNTIELPANSQQKITIYLDVPENANDQQMYWSMLLFRGILETESLNGKGKSTKATIEESYQIGVHIYYESDNLTETSAILNNLKQTGPTQFQMLIDNTGKTQIQGLAHLELIHLETGKEFNLPETKVPIFPGFSCKLTLTVPDSLPRGSYSGLAILDYGDSFPLEGYEFEYDKKK